MRGISLKSLRNSLVLAGMLTFVLAGSLFAQQTGEPLKAVMTASKIVVRNGVETKQPAELVKPGDIVEYTVEYRNQSSKPVRDVRGTLPIPTGMSYENGSATPKNFWASTDGKNFSVAPLKRRQKNADGSESEVLVPLKEYRALRWDLGEIAPNATSTVKARVKVLIGTAPAVPPATH
jgi:uncharacterized repeat protein (TIGR01451 family)